MFVIGYLIAWVIYIVGGLMLMHATSPDRYIGNDIDYINAGHKRNKVFCFWWCSGLIILFITPMIYLATTV